MAGNKVLGPTSRDTAEWNSAWEVVRRLAAARRSALHELKEADPLTPAAGGGTDITVAPGPSEHAVGTAAESGQYARAIAEIEQASAALRRAEPALETWLPDAATLPDAAAQSEPRHPRSVWILVGGIWLSTVLVVASAIGATLFLLG